jgi:hypothetical protein
MVYAAIKLISKMRCHSILESSLSFAFQISHNIRPHSMTMELTGELKNPL